jgi:proteic killer suppression protein
MNLKSIRHKGLKRFIEDDDPSGLPSAKVEKIRDIVSALLTAQNVEDIPALPGWRLHKLHGDRKGQWSITLTGNWRIVFEVKDDEIYRLDLEDYH